MDITLRITTRRVVGPGAAPAEVRDQLIEDIASLGQVALDHLTEDGNRTWSTYTIETVRAVEDGS
jgi:hypothetical protein